MQNDELLTALSELFDEVDPVDPIVLEQARMAYSWRTIDAELAELAYDSLADRRVLAAVRDGGAAGAGPRMLGFGTDLVGDEESGLTVEIEVTTERGRTTLVGQLMPPCAALVGVERFGPRRGTTAVVPADDLGRFRIEQIPDGPIRLRIDVGDRIIETSWMSYAASA